MKCAQQLATVCLLTMTNASRRSYVTLFLTHYTSNRSNVRLNIDPSLEFRGLAGKAVPVSRDTQSLKSLKDHPTDARFFTEVYAYWTPMSSLTGGFRRSVMFNIDAHLYRLLMIYQQMCGRG
jgi:hypothetical protein